MKFAKELENELVPEWRAKYLNYKLGKKKVKALSRALARASRPSPLRPRGGQHPTPTQRLPPNTSTSVSRFPLDDTVSSHSYHGSPSRRPSGRVQEQRPLHTPGSRFANMATGYGSILSEHGPSITKVPSLELPDPAIDPEDVLASQQEDGVQPAEPHAPPSYSVLLRSKSFGGDGVSRTQSFLRRVLNTAEAASPGMIFQSGNLVSEVAQREREFFEFLDAELDKIETFYRQKEQEATERLQALRQQLQMMRDQAHQSGRHPSRHSDGRRSSHALSVLPSKRWSRAIAGKDVATQEPPSAAADRRDFARRAESPEVSYRTAKRRLKLALQEYYRGLELLKSYAYLNRKAFRKINKKYDKAVNMRHTFRYMSEKVNKAYFVQSEVVEDHMAVVEDLYTRYFEKNGNRKIAVGKLRGKVRSNDYSASTFRVGLLLAAGVVGCIQGLILAARHLRDSDDDDVQLQTSYLLQIYGGYFLIVFHTLLFCLDCMIWARSKINYVFVFEFDARHVLDWRQLSEIPSFFFLLLGLFMWLNFSWVNNMFIYYPIVLIVITLVILYLPFKTLYYRSRAWWAYSNWRLWLSGLYPVEFRDFFLGDMYCSQTYAMGNIELFFCLYATHWENPTVCSSSRSRLLGFFTTLPSIWRGLQCLRRYYSTRNVFPHLANFVKYMFGILYYMSLSLYRVERKTRYDIAFIVLAFINSCYCSVWDIAMDWSLGNPYSKNRFLRDHLSFRRLWVYYIAVIVDVIVRFNWIFYAVFPRNMQHSALLTFVVSLSEVCRRGLWSVFRVENEHCTNVTLYRASRDIPLPYNVEPVTAPGELTPVDGAADASAAAVMQQTVRPATSPAATPTGADVEAGRWKTPSSMRARHPELVRTMSRMGNAMAAAHAQDFQRKNPPESMHVRSPEIGAEAPDDSSDEEDEDVDTDSPASVDVDDRLPSPEVYRDSPRRN